MAPKQRILRMYTQPSEAPPLDWDWVDERLASAGLYWVTARGPGHPHPRPVWGIWHEQQIYVSLGSPVLRRELAADPQVTINLESGSEVVIVEGTVIPGATTRQLVDVYDRKYEYEYDLWQYGDFTQVAPSRVFAWRTAGPAGRDGFAQTGSWEFGAGP